MRHPRRRRELALAALVSAAIILLGIVLGVLLGGDQGRGPAPARPATVTVRPTTGPPIVAKAATVAKARAQAVDGQAAPTGEAEVKGGKAEALTPAARARLDRQARAGTSGSDSPTPIAQGASFSQEGCRTIPVANYSSRGSSRPGLGVAHYTVSKNRPGWGDVLAIVGLFNNPRFQASSNYVIDAEGHCAYIVSEAGKAWTQGGMNPASACSIEQIGDASDNGYRGPGLAKAALVFRACFRRWGIPIRLGATSGCNITRTGLVDHKELGCGNDHTDISPYSVATILRAMGSSSSSAAATAKLTKAERQIVARRFYHRAKRFTRGASSAQRGRQLGFSRKWKAAAGRQKRRLDAAHARGQSWRTDSIGIRRRAMARAERFNRADRQALRK